MVDPERLLLQRNSDKSLSGDTVLLSHMFDDYDQNAGPEKDYTQQYTLLDAMEPLLLYPSIHVHGQKLLFDGDNWSICDGSYRQTA